MKNTFNSNFYLMTSTVIPVLYLALILQATMIGRVITVLTEAVETIRNRKPASVVAGLLGWAMYYTWMVMGLGGFAILYVGFGGELESILALFHGSDTYSQRKFVLFSAITLLILTLATPAWTIFRDWKNSFIRFIPWF